MLLIGESLNVISKKIGAAFKERDPKPIQEEALFQKEKGMDYIDINLGPAKKDGHELMPWVVEVVQDVVPDVPLALDTSNIDAIEAALEVIKQVPNGTPYIVNSSWPALSAMSARSCWKNAAWYRLSPIGATNSSPPSPKASARTLWT